MLLRTFRANLNAAVVANPDLDDYYVNVVVDDAVVDANYVIDNEAQFVVVQASGAEVKADNA